MNKPVFKTAGLMTAAAIFTTVIFAQTKPPVPTFTDSRGGRAYKSLTLGKQAWMAENPNYNAGNGSRYFAAASAGTCFPCAACKTKYGVA
jgi:hypothetical protein